MKPLVFALLCLGFIAAQDALARFAGFSVARADLPVIFALFLAARCGTIGGALGAAACGLFVDTLGGHPTGLYLFSSLLAFAAARLLVPLFELKGAARFALVTAALDLLHNFSVLGLVSLASAPETSQLSIARAIPGCAALTFAVALALWPLLTRLDRALKKGDSGALK